ncbi:MAG: Lrp/AsnC family transcriptional regulator [Promethearchaeia archaeon]
MKNISELDPIDKGIIEHLQKDPQITHTEIAKRVNRSQPTIGMRIEKLKKAGILQFQAGINLKKAQLVSARAEIQTNNPGFIKKIVKKCPFMINAFRLTGVINMSIFLIGECVEDLDRVVNCHFRNNPNVKKVEFNVISDILSNFVLPVNLDFSNCENLLNNSCCCGFRPNSLL